MGNVLAQPYFENRSECPALQSLCNLEQYLDSLSSDPAYLPTFCEDWYACRILIDMILPANGQRIAHWVLDATLPCCHRSRTLEVWKDIHRQLTRMVQKAEGLVSSQAPH
jgi:hypothetical protein